ncbi:MAG TPA: DUF4010 domain-containing protein [Candidatus Thermoplasmatota archaeon]|nr:DUF4010 domain-containing protein [Candidatus Thermoplasmatota archaeon]
MAASELLAQTVDTDLLVRMGVGLAVGALIGLERERHRDARTVLAGIRTYPLVALGGVLFAHLGKVLTVTSAIGDYYVAIGALVFGAISLVLYWVRHELGLHGLTSPIALFLTYVAGALIGLGFVLEGVIAGVATAVLLFTKPRLHRLAEVMTEEEMSGALQFIVLAFILYPLFANRAVDPWGIVHPKHLLLVVIFVSSVSFVSFIVMRRLGASRGLTISGLLGGLVNSEAATTSLAHLGTEKPTLRPAVVEAITLANATMLLRNLLIAGFVDPTLRLATAMAPALLGTLLVQGVFTLRRADPSVASGETIRLRNPFAIRPALRFGLLVLVFSAIGAGLGHLGGDGGPTILLTAVGGLVSSAAVVASVGTLWAHGNVTLTIAVLTAVLTSLVSTLNKLLVTRAVDAGLVRPLLARFLISTVIGVALLVATLILT